MDVRLQELLVKLKVDDNRTNQDTYTHITYFGPHQKWTIRPSNWGEFWLNYCDLIQDPKGIFCLAEKSNENMPIIVDLTLKFHRHEDGDPDRTLYDEEFVMGIVYAYQQAMRELLQLKDPYFQSATVVMSSNKDWFENDLVCRQMRIQFPYCRVDTLFQVRTLRPLAIQLLRKYNIISKLPSQPINDWESIINPLVPQEPLTLFHSVAQPNQRPMDIDYIMGIVENGNIDSKSIPFLDLDSTFDPRHHSHVKQGLVSPDIFEEKYGAEHWIPLYLSTLYWSEITLIKNSIEAGPMNSTTQSSSNRIVTPKSTSPQGVNIADESPIEMAERLLTMLGRHRVEKDHFWLDVGKSLYNCDEGGENGLQTWIRFTDRSDSHVEEECRNLYPTFRDNNNLTIKTIAWYAKEDCPDGYDNWHKQWCRPAMDSGVSCLHADVAKSLYRTYWLEFTCCSLDQSQWYQYKNHRWIKLDHGITLRQYISDDFIRKFEKIRNELGTISFECGDKSMRDTSETMIKKITNLISNLKKVHLKQNIMREAMEHFYDPNFANIIDMNPNLLGLLNGVLEIVKDKAEIRSGKPEDYVTMCTGIPYRAEFSMSTDLVKTLMKWMRQVFTDEKLCDYFLKMSASCLKGRNDDKIFPIWTGEGDNSKSMIVKLFEAAFGPYCIKFPTSLLTGKRTGSSSAMPELARSKSTRLALLQEPDDEETIRGGILKELTGGDSFFVRNLHEKGGEVQAMFKMILMCNKVPAIPTGGKAVKNRTRIVPFMSTWVNNPPQSEDEQFEKKLFKKDPFFEVQIPRLAQAFMWLLVQYYPKYIREGIDEPPIVKEATSQYSEDNDIYRQFIGECIVAAKTEDDQINNDSSLSQAEIYREFKAWYRDSFPGNKPPDSNTVKMELINHGRLGKQGPKRRWYGICLATRNTADNVLNL